MADILVKAAFVGLTWGVLSFGAVYPWAHWPLIVLLGAIGLVGLVTACVDTRAKKRHGTRAGTSSRLKFDLVTGLAFALAALCFATVLQLIPLPATTLRSLSAATDRLLVQYDLGYALERTTDIPSDIAKAAVVPGGSVTHPISIDPDATGRGLAFLVSFSVFIFGLAATLSRTGSSRFGLSIVVLGAFVAIVGIIQEPLFSGKIYGFWSPRFHGDPFGPFVNKNHFAGWMLMALSASIGTFCHMLAQSVHTVRPGWRRRLLWMSSPQASKQLLVAFALAVMALSLVLSMSRSGITCFVLGLAIGTVLGARRLPHRSGRILAAGYLGLLFVISIGWAGLDLVMNRFAEASWGDVGGRLGAWKDAARVIQDFPLTGTGLNTYGTSMLFYQTYAAGELHFREAHNDPLQLAAEGGLLLGIPALLAIGFLVALVRQRFREPSSEDTYWLRVGAVVGIVTIALQELVEFSLQMPGNAALFSVLVALAIHRAPPDAALVTHGTRGSHRERFVNVPLPHTYTETSLESVQKQQM